MPVVSKNDLQDMQTQIDDLEERNEELTKYYEKKLKDVRSEKNGMQTLSIAFLVLGIVLALGAGGFWYMKVYKAKPKVIVKEKIVDKPVEVLVEVPPETPTFYYAIQLLASKKEKVGLATGSIQCYTKNGINEYLFGTYATYKEAKESVWAFDAIGFKDCYIVAIKDGTKIAVEEALAISGE